MKLKRIIGVSLVASFVGCKSTITDEEVKKQRELKADKYFSMLEKQVIDNDKEFTIQDCIEYALKNNIDLQVSQLAEKIQKEKSEASFLGMLPELSFSSTTTKRDKENTSSSKNLATGQIVNSTTTSSEKETTVDKFNLTFSILDFGLSYYTSIQETDRARIAKYQRKKAEQDLSLKVSQAYYKVAAAQYAMTNTEKLLALSLVIEKNLEVIAKNKALSPLRVMSEKKQVLKLKQKLVEYKRAYQNSCIELKSLMGVHSWNNVKLDVKALKNIKEFEIADIKTLEKIALRNRDELYQLDAQVRIDDIEVDKMFMMMFPNATFFHSMNSTSNKYTDNQHWNEIGVSATYNLLRLPQNYKKWKLAGKNISKTEAQTYALTAAIIAQVRIAHVNITELKERYYLANTIFNTNIAQLKAAKAQMKAGGKISQLELFKMAMETATASVTRAQELGNYYLTYYKLLNAVGTKNLTNIEEKIVIEENKDDDEVIVIEIE